MSTTDPEQMAQPGAAARTGLIGYFAGNPVAANLLMLVLVAGGIASGYRLAVQQFPEIDLRTVTVTVRFPGASPQEVEQDINRRVEESVIGLAGVERVVAAATEGLARIRIELATFANAGSVLTDVRNAVDAIENFPPRNAERADIKLEQLVIEAMTLAVSSSVVSENELRLAAENVRSELLELPSISQVTLRGTRDREIAIELSEEELRRNDLSIAGVSAAVQRASLNLTFGELRTESGGVVLHTIAKRSIGEEFEGIPLITRLNGDHRDARRRRRDPRRIRRRRHRRRGQRYARRVRAHRRHRAAVDRRPGRRRQELARRLRPPRRTSRSPSGTTRRSRPSNGCRQSRETDWPEWYSSSPCCCSFSTCAPRCG